MKFYIDMLITSHETIHETFGNKNHEKTRVSGSTIENLRRINQATILESLFNKNNYFFLNETWFEKKAAIIIKKNNIYSNRFIF